MLELIVTWFTESPRVYLLSIISLILLSWTCCCWRELSIVIVTSWFHSKLCQSRVITLCLFNFELLLHLDPLFIFSVDNPVICLALLVCRHWPIPFLFLWSLLGRPRITEIRYIKGRCSCSRSLWRSASPLFSIKSVSLPFLGLIDFLVYFCLLTLLGTFLWSNVVCLLVAKLVQKTRGFCGHNLN